MDPWALLSVAYSDASDRFKPLVQRAFKSILKKAERVRLENKPDPSSDR